MGRSLSTYQALKDITKHLENNNIKIRDENNDKWVVTGWDLDNKEQRKLNYELGINKINYFGNKNRKYE